MDTMPLPQRKMKMWSGGDSDGSDELDISSIDDMEEDTSSDDDNEDEDEDMTKTLAELNQKLKQTNKKRKLLVQRKASSVIVVWIMDSLVMMLMRKIMIMRRKMMTMMMKVKKMMRVWRRMKMMRKEGVLKKFSKSTLDEEVQKGNAVKNQIAIYESVFQDWIKVHMKFGVINQLPQPGTFSLFRGDQEFDQSLKQSQTCIKKLLDELVGLQREICKQNNRDKISQWCRRTKTGVKVSSPVEVDDDDEEIPSDSDMEPEEQVKQPEPEEKPAKPIRSEAYPQYLAERHQAFIPYRNSTIQKWY